MINAETQNYREILNEYFLIKKEMNPSYSLRSFARDLDLPSSNLSSVLNGKLGLSKVSAEQITTKLKIVGSEKEKFINLVLASDARSKKEKILARGRLKKHELREKKEIQEDYFKLISEWYYYTILELVTLEQFESDHEWISKQLGVDKKTVNEAMARLVRLGLINKVDGVYHSTGAQLDTTYDTPSYFIKKHNTQMLTKASEAVIHQDVAKRETSTLTIALNGEDIQYVKNKIRTFRNEIDKELMERAKKKGANRVYLLAIQFFDLLKGNDNETN